MAETVLFRDTFDGPAGPVDEGRAPDVGAYEFLIGGELDGLGILTCDELRSGGSATPNPAATYRAAIELLTTGGLGGVELGAGGGAYFWAEVRFVGGVGLVVSPGTQDSSFDDVPVSMPGDAVPLSIEVGPSGTDVSYMGDVVATIPTFTSASFSGAGLYARAYSVGGGGAVALNYVELTQSAPTDGGGGSPPTAPVDAVALAVGLDTSWEAAQELAGSGGVGSGTEVYALLRRDVFDGAAGELSGRTFPTQVGASGVGAAWTSGLSTPPRLDGSGALEVSDAAYFDDDGGYGAPTAGATIPQPATGTPIRVSAQVHVPPSAAASYVWGARFKVVEPALLSNPAYRHTRISVHIKNMTASDAIKVSRVVQYSEVGYVDEVSFSASVGGSGDRLERISLGGTSLKLLANGVEQDLVLPWALPADSDGLVDVSAFFFSEGWAYTGVPTRLRMFELAVTDGTFASAFWTNFVNSVEEV